MFYIYQVKNDLNGNIYVGAHEGDSVDEYLGSGRLVLRAIEKYGREHFTKTVLCICETREEMYVKEAELVNEAFVARADTYNICVGGNGGARPNSGPPLGNKCHLGARHDGVMFPRYKQRPPHTEESKKKMSLARQGKKRSPETIAKQRATLHEYWQIQKAKGVVGRLNSGMRG